MPPPPVRPYPEDEELIAATRADGAARARLYPWPEPAVVLGRGSRPEAELHLEACLADGAPLYRRRGGGCAVVLDPGNVVVALAFRRPGIAGVATAFRQALAWLCLGLARLGLPEIRQEGISDLALGDRKVGGTCLYRGLDLVFFTATVLVAPRLDLVERYLRHPPREPAWRRGRPHREFMSPGLGPLLGGADAARLCRELAPHLDPAALAAGKGA